MCDVFQMSCLKVIGQGCGAQTVIFASAVLSAAVICPALGRFEEYLVSVLIALGAGCLTGDAIFHLLPHALNPYHHHDHGGRTREGEHRLVLWRSILVIASVYFFYLFHIFFHSTQGSHSHSHVAKSEANENKKLLSANGGSVQPAKSNKAVVWMMLVGELLHTASDGLAIGAAFSNSAGDGLSTSLAVLFHEIPHAVGAFAVFLSAGLTICRALCLLTVCYICSYIGVVLGAILGATFHLTAWIFAIIAGMFLYIALAEMIPEMFSAISSATANRRCFLILQNLGLILGFAIMATLASFESTVQKVLE